MPHRSAAEGSTVLIAAPYGRDAASVAGLLADRGLITRVCADLSDLARCVDDRAGVLLITEEALHGEQRPLAEALAAQPEWSDVPFIMLAAPRVAQTRSIDSARARLPEMVDNAVVLERPLGVESLVSAINSALRLRQKQFEMRDRLLDLQSSRAALAASEAELRLVADALPVLIGFIDRDGIYRFANRAYEEWLGQRPEEVVGRHLEEVVGPAILSTRRSAIERAFSGENVRFETAWPHTDGRRRDAEIRYLPRINAAGAVDGIHVFVLDVTDRKVVEEQLSQRVAERTAALEAEMAGRASLEEALRQSQKMEAVGQLTGGIAHDFNNMLTGVIGGLDILKRRIASGRLDDVDRFMDAASTSAQRAAALTARLLAFSRRQSLDAKPVDVNGLARSLEDLLRRTIGENIALEIAAGEDVPLAIVDANQLESAILNLAINARDAMPDGGLLTVETCVSELDDAYAGLHPDVKAGRYVVVAVSDTGVGIEKDVLERVFEPFFTTKAIGQGTGLGLSMIYGFARQSGGQVRIHSEPGQGTSVKIYLPATEAPSDTSAIPATPVREGTGQTVLIVEDDPSVRILVREVLNELSYRAIEAEDANAAIPILASDQAIDLMVSDVGLPGMNGRQLAEVARQHRPDLPILFVTGYAENAANRAGFLGTNMTMITKPFALANLARRISELMQGEPADASRAERTGA
ncbi:ATP-binding protein [Sphingomonas sp. GC_Shp_3]|uniref:ATP-binding protein n=1 Tax=Sphingomonas sp. GC_Shp_3 TaxID=2937383 RepID=UPI002269A4F3